MNKKIFQIVVNAKAGSFASVVTLVEVKIPKKWGLNGVVTCRTEKSVQVGANYQSSVNGHRKAEGKDADFVAESLPWGEWLVVDRVITHKDKYYARLYDINGGVHKKTYYINGVEATEAEICIINEWYKSKAHTSRQGVVKEVKPTSVCFDNIEYLSCGDVYTK